MKKTAAVLLLLVAGVALATKGYSLSSTQSDIDDCTTGGDTAITVTAGVYIFRVLQEDAYICLAAAGASNTCASGGHGFPAGTNMPLEFGSSVSFNCRSSAGTADTRLTKVR